MGVSDMFASSDFCCFSSFTIFFSFLIISLWFVAAVPAAATNTTAPIAPSFLLSRCCGGCCVFLYFFFSHVFFCIAQARSGNTDCFAKVSESTITPCRAVCLHISPPCEYYVISRRRARSCHRVRYAARGTASRAAVGYWGGTTECSSAMDARSAPDAPPQPAALHTPSSSTARPPSSP